MKHTLLGIYLLMLTYDSFSQKNGDIRQFQLNKKVLIDMLYIAPGSFLMGSPDEELERNSLREQQHLVKLTRGYWVATYETSQKV